MRGRNRTTATRRHRRSRWRRALRCGALPGSLVGIGGHRLHVYRAGSGRPAVVFEAALAGCHAHWTGCKTAYHVRRPPVVTIAPVSAGAIRVRRRVPPSDRVRAAMLANAGIEPPRIMVGHSFGALPLRVYAAMFPSEVAGLVIVDPIVAEEWIPTTAEQRHTIEKGVTLCHRGAFAARIGVARIVAALAATAHTAGATGRNGSEPGAFTRRTSISGAVHEVTARGLRGARCNVDAAEKLRQRWRARSKVSRSLSCRPLASRYLVTCRSRFCRRATPGPHGLDARDRLLAGCAAGRHAIVAASSHWIQLDQPQLSAETIRSIGSFGWVYRTLSPMSMIRTSASQPRTVCVEG